MAKARNPLDAEANNLFGSARESLSDTLQRFGVAIFQGNTQAARGELDNLTEDLRAIMMLANLAGRLRVYQRADEIDAGHDGPRTRIAFAKGVRVGTRATGIPGELPRVPFKEAIASLIEREPRLEADYKVLARLYSSDNVFGLARATDITVTERVQAILTRFMRAGGDPTKTHDAIKMVGGFTDSYADTVFRTNVGHAYSDGRIAKLNDPVVRSVIPAMRFTAVNDPDTRHNHKAADGIIASPEWFQASGFKPPIGYNCRCRLDFVDALQAKRAGVLTATGKVKDPDVPRGAFPDRGFRS